MSDGNNAPIEKRGDWYIEKKGIVAVIGNRDSRADSVCAAIACSELKNIIAKRKGSKAKYIACRAGELSNATKYALKKLELETPKLYFDLCEEPGGRNSKIILIGHNDLRNAADGLIPEQIIEIVDRHPLGGFKTKKVVRVRIDPLGSTSTIVAKLFRERDVEISEKIASLLLCGIVTATAGLTTYTTQDEDRSIAEQLSEIAGLKITDLTAEFEEFRPIRQFEALTEEEEPIKDNTKKKRRRLWR